MPPKKRPTSTRPEAAAPPSVRRAAAASSPSTSSTTPDSDPILSQGSGTSSGLGAARAAAPPSSDEDHTSSAGTPGSGSSSYATEGSIGSAAHSGASHHSAVARTVGAQSVVSCNIDERGKIIFEVHGERVRGIITGGGSAMGDHTTAYQVFLETICALCADKDPINVPGKIERLGSLYPGFTSLAVREKSKFATEMSDCDRRIDDTSDEKTKTDIRKSKATEIGRFVSTRAQHLLETMNTAENTSFSRTDSFDSAPGRAIQAETARIPILRDFLDLRSAMQDYERLDGDEKHKALTRASRLVGRINPDLNGGKLGYIGISDTGVGIDSLRARSIVRSFEENHSGTDRETHEQRLASRLVPIIANTFDFKFACDK